MIRFGIQTLDDRATLFGESDRDTRPPGRLDSGLGPDHDIGIFMMKGVNFVVWGMGEDGRNTEYRIPYSFYENTLQGVFERAASK